jgi:F0F1-type ATP synthase assembly protein I
VADQKAGPTSFSAGDFAGVGVQFVAAILVFLFLGKWVDGRLGTTPVFLLLGTFVGAAGGFYSMYRKVTAAARASQRASQRASGVPERGADDR